MTNKQKILVVDDDNHIAELISLYLVKEMFETRVAGDGEEALQLFRSFEPDLILLDIMLPGIEVFDKVLGLELGADDYMEKPFDSKEMVARVKAVLRRYKLPLQKTGDRRADKKVSYPELEINMTNYTVICGGKKIEMPPKELELFYFLASEPNHVFTREQLLDQIWGYEYVGDTRTVDVHIKRLREKVGEQQAWSIATIWGIGYKFEVK